MPAAVLILTLLAQEGALDVLDGETLYEGGWLFTLSAEYERRSGLIDGRDSVSDPLDHVRTDTTFTTSAHYGLRHDLQLSLLVPYVSRELENDAGRASESGLGDTAALAKFRFKRFDGPGWSLNIAAIGGLDLPTGADADGDAPYELAPGTGSWDPFAGVAATYEPNRWRFNAFAVYKRNGEGHDDVKIGDQFLAEIAAGNRFHLTPYPGPFWRFDVMLRYRREWRDRIEGDIIHNTGSDVTTVGANLAFRPRPSLDFQLEAEVPIWQRADGVQLEADFQVMFTVGLRL